MLTVLFALSAVQAPMPASPSERLTIVHRYLAQERVADAARLARDLVAAHPASAEAHAVAGDAVGAFAGSAGVLRIIGLARECRGHYAQALTIDAANLRALEGMAGYLAQAPRMLGGNLDSAIRVAAALERVDSARGMVLRAILMSRNARSAETDALVTRALTLSTDTTLLERAADYFTATGQHRRAVELHLARLAADSTAERLWYATARSQIAAGDTADAVVALREAWTRARARGDDAWLSLPRPAWRLARISLARNGAADASNWTDSVLLVDHQHAGARRLRDSRSARSKNGR